MIYDQTKHQNHLSVAPRKDGAHHIKDLPCNATRDKLTIGGHQVYSAYFEGGMGYRNDNTSGIAVQDQAETMYMVTSGVHYNGRCCFDYGNAETNNLDDGAGTMEAIYFGSAKGGLNHGGAGAGPWIMADMENALWGSDVIESNETLINHTFVTAMVKGDVSDREVPGPYQPEVDYSGTDVSPCGDPRRGRHACTLPANSTHLDCEAKCNSTQSCMGYVFADASCSGDPLHALCWTKGSMNPTNTTSCRSSRVMVPKGSHGHWAIKGGDAQGGALHVYWDGKRAPGYAPMRKQGAIVLGIGGDNSDASVGTFYEGVMTSGYSSPATDDKIQANIVAAGYGK
jgi:hypothetical protein